MNEMMKMDEFHRSTYPINYQMFIYLLLYLFLNNFFFFFCKEPALFILYTIIYIYTNLLDFISTSLPTYNIYLLLRSVSRLTSK